jgi:hypothetical protein
MMPFARFSIALIVAAATSATIPPTASGQNVPAACRPLVDAELKTLRTPHHMYETEADANASQKPLAELITAGGVTYVKSDGKWMRSPISLKAQIDQENQNVAASRVYACQRVGSESVAGVPATVYTLHTENADTKADARVWMGTGTGLMLKMDESVDASGTKMHYLIRYEYTNVTAPVGAP